jgi:hypothetical protein
MPPGMPSGLPPQGAGNPMHAIMAHAMGAMGAVHAAHAVHAAGGLSYVPSREVAGDRADQWLGSLIAPQQLSKEARSANIPSGGQDPNSPYNPNVGQMGVATPQMNHNAVVARYPENAYAGGTSSVPISPAPAPGQTITGGTWTPPNANPPSGQNQDLRAKMGMGIKAATGATRVPGKGAPNVDKVPAILAPGEAVLNEGAATHMGRGAITALNALGAHAMAMHGTPPPGMPVAKDVRPIGRGMPPAKAKAKAPMPPMKGKVAAGSKGE